MTFRNVGPNQSFDISGLVWLTVQSLDDVGLRCGHCFDGIHLGLCPVISGLRSLFSGFYDCSLLLGGGAGLPAPFPHYCWFAVVTYTRISFFTSSLVYVSCAGSSSTMLNRSYAIAFLVSARSALRNVFCGNRYVAHRLAICYTFLEVVTVWVSARQNGKTNI